MKQKSCITFQQKLEVISYPIHTNEYHGLWLYCLVEMRAINESCSCVINGNKNKMRTHQLNRTYNCVDVIKYFPIKNGKREKKRKSNINQMERKEKYSWW